MLRQTRRIMDTGSTSRSRAQRVAEWFRWLVRPQLCFGGLAVGAVFSMFSLTPSLLPRSGIAQGVVSGLSLVCGYGIGSGLSALLRTTPITEPSAGAKRIAWWTLAAE